MHNGALAAPEDLTGSDLEVIDSATSPGQPARRTEQPARTHLRVTVNYQQVVLSERVMTGLEIKQAAIAQGVEIGPGFQLSVKRGDHYDVVGDTDEVHIHEHQDFLAVAPDDNS